MGERKRENETSNKKEHKNGKKLCFLFNRNII